MKKRIDNSEEELEVLRKIEENPKLTQRQIADHLGLSLGKLIILSKPFLEKACSKLIILENPITRWLSVFTYTRRCREGEINHAISSA